MWSIEVTATSRWPRSLTSRASSTVEPLPPELEQMMKMSVGSDVVHGEQLGGQRRVALQVRVHHLVGA